ncbi:hypothetical protein [Caldifermentibacillus hisashii]|uniref:hypothetical protein n=1 Tax=Caldifermentibacillus hisashii TaxID=996558 RepID=UPI0022B97C9B|nr:hypothetical protein [Caldifermentibacillus hisashii]
MTRETPYFGVETLLVTTLRLKTHFFDDETLSRHHFEPKIARFWRRDPFSSPFWGGKCSILATRPFLVTILGRKLLVFDDETPSRRRFEAENPLFGDETLSRHHFEPENSIF